MRYQSLNLSPRRSPPQMMCYPVVLPPPGLPGELSEGGFQWVPRSLDSMTHHDVTTWAMSLQVINDARTAQTIREEFQRGVWAIGVTRVQRTLLGCGWSGRQRQSRMNKTKLIKNVNIPGWDLKSILSVKRMKTPSPPICRTCDLDNTKSSLEQPIPSVGQGPISRSQMKGVRLRNSYVFLLSYFCLCHFC